MSKYLPINKVVESVSITHKFNKHSLLFLNTSDIERGKIINKKVIIMLAPKNKVLFKFSFVFAVNFISYNASA